jgi:hypothetical protein
LGTFRILVRRSTGGAALPIKSLAAVPAASHLIWEPVHLPLKNAGSAEVTAILVPPSGEDLVVLKPRKAGVRADWQLTMSPAAIALVFGPQGLSEGKVKSLVTHDRQLVGEIADYAEQTSKVESLVQELSDAEQSGGTDAALKGFSARYGVALPKLDGKVSSDQQAATLLKTVLPTTNGFDPLASRDAQVQQSAGLAASVAGLFFGSTVGLAAGGTALISGIKTAFFPGTDFRSAFAQNDDKASLALCTKNSAAKPHTRIAYLWAYRVPNLKLPAIALSGATHLPLGVASSVKLSATKGTVKELERARDWRLVPAAGGSPEPVDFHLAAAPDTAEIDLTHAKVQPGDYRLTASWDWDTLEVGGVLHLHALADLGHLHLAPEWCDKLIEGSGTIHVKLSGPDFEFVEKAAVASAAVTPAKMTETRFALPLGKRAGVQNTLEIDLDTAARGSFLMLLTQSDGRSGTVAYTVLPPSPVLSGLPVRVNHGDTTQALHLQGSGLERIEAVTSDAGEIEGGFKESAWSGRIKLKPGVAVGTTFAVSLKVRGLTTPLVVPDAIRILGPRPVITAARKSIPATLGLAVHHDELPAGVAAGLSLEIREYHDPAGGGATARPRVELGCKSGGLRKSLTLSPDDRAPGAELTVAAPGMLFLAIDPASVGYPGCVLTATVDVEPEGRSDPFVIGRVVRMPRLEQFILTNEQIDPSTYAGTLKGRDLDVIEKTGWDPQHGIAVDSVPTPVPGEPGLQTMRIALSWPAPAPHAPLYIWLRGETEGRKTSASY